ncbi:MAG: alpha/beta hydrolase, partial [Owenweeksia sp.]
ADREEYPTTGHSDAFIRFLKEEVQPLVENRYPVKEGERTLIGQSLGGLLATEILFKNPGMFDHYIIISPSLWWDAQSLLDTEPGILSLPGSVYIGVGEEGEVMKKDASSLHEKLRKKYPERVRLHFQYFPNRDHGDALHEAVYDAFEKIYR